MDTNFAVTIGAKDYYSDELEIEFTSHTFHGHWKVFKKSRETVDFFGTPFWPWRKLILTRTASTRPRKPLAVRTVPTGLTHTRSFSLC
jgi:hypothetical protein